uniref:non-specific serine/threonine protein kinase n=1 Tax=Chenopodium quinoa TaxID=63459 RepID=A0A803KNJ2_CHEQI
MISTFFSSIYFSFIITFVILGVSLSNGEDPNYKTCSARFSCGQIKHARYPFWGGNRPRICGISDFKLNCGNDDKNSPITYMNFVHNGYATMSVFFIDRSSQAMIVSLDNLLKKYVLFNASTVSLLPALILKPAGKNQKMIYLYYGCASCVSRYRPFYSFNCSNDKDATISSVYYFGGPSVPSVAGKSLLSSCSCNNRIYVPVVKKRLDELRSGNGSLESILKTLIRMEYTVNFTACSKCEDSGGRCGSRPPSDEFVCYCPDGPQSSECPQSAVSTSICSKCKESGGRCGSSGASVGGFLLLGIVMMVVLKAMDPKRYTYADIRKMTNSFKEKLGEGGYGSVYKGRLHDGRLVAVKKLKFSKSDGKDFTNEVLSMSRTNHVNIVTLLGFCFEGNNRALVFEFLPNGSLEKFMHGRDIDKPLRWKTKFDIAIGIAKGLDYLHRGCNMRILHFDIKPHNILLDEEFRPKISDFGLARLCLPKNSTISMSEARGTIGYIAPEVICRYYGSVSHKSDVYSYGMMLLDLVCGRQIGNSETLHSEMYFPEWIYNRLELVEDVSIHDQNNKELERKMIIVSLWCIQSFPANRPSMNQVVDMLEGSLESLQIPPKPNRSSSARFVFGSSPVITTLDDFCQP